MKSVPLAALATLLLIAAPHARPETWAQVAGGSFVIPENALSRIRTTLGSEVAAAAKAQGQKLPPWRDFLVQFRATEVKGMRVVEIHGSCHVEPGYNASQEFLDEQITDGGTCYFSVLYRLDTGHYSNVVFHGYA